MKQIKVWILWDTTYEKPLSVWESEKLLLEEVARLEKYGEDKNELEWSSSFGWNEFKLNEKRRV